jgi:assimilatory nitrate reductase catalytic subunit
VVVLHHGDKTEGEPVSNFSAPFRLLNPSLFKARTGALTRELVREPGGFGLGQVPSSRKPDSTAVLACGFCSTGCSLTVHLRNGKPVGLTPTTHYPVNLGMACPKGWEALAPLVSPDRATTPLWRDASGEMQPISWDAATRTFTDRFRAIIDEHGPDSVAFLSTGQIPSEEMAFLGALAKFGMGFVHGDGNTRQCMATSVSAYKESFGFDAPPYTYADFEESDVIVLVGSNLCITHPIMWERICRNPNSPQIVVIDPRTTETAAAATQHLAIKPKSDLVLLYAVANVLMRNGWVDESFVAAHTDGFDEMAAHVAAFTPEAASIETGLRPEAIEGLARSIHEGTKVSFWWTMGVNQSHEGTRTAQAIINVALMTGNIGRPGTGANSITGQCNAMGSRQFSNTASLYCGRDFTNPADRSDVATILGIDESTIPTRTSAAYDQIIAGVLDGRIKGLWVIATNTAHSWIAHSELQRALSALEFLVVQDMYATSETARLAHLVLPAAGWGEKEGTFINSERRVATIRRVAVPPGEALSDFAIFRLLAEAWGCAAMFARWTSPQAVFEIMAELSVGRPCDISGIEGYEDLDRSGGIQWPFTRTDRETATGEGQAGPTKPKNDRPNKPAERRLFENGRFFHPNGRARFVVDTPREVPTQTSGSFPLVLLTGRGSSAQWHTGTRTAKSAVLVGLSESGPTIEMNHDDARSRFVEAGDDVVVESRRGSMQARVSLATTVPSGSVFVSMHHPDTNRVTEPVFDPHSRQPSYKYTAVEVRRAGRRPT